MNYLNSSKNKKAFDELGMKKVPTVKSLQTEYAQLLEEKKKAYVKYQQARNGMRELLTVKANVDQLLALRNRKRNENYVFKGALGNPPISSLGLYG